MKTPYLVVAALLLIALSCLRLDRRPDVKTQVQASFQLSPAHSESFSRDEAVHLVYWEKWNGFEGEAMQACVDRFNQLSLEAARSKDPVRRSRFLTPEGRSIAVHMLSTTQVNRKTLLAVSGGVPPDIAGLWSRDVPDFAQYQAALPLDDLVRRDGPTPEEYHRCYWEMCVYGGRVWALPTAPATVALHWNKQLFREAGLDPDVPPRTLAELDAFNRRLTRRDPDGRIVQMGFLPTEPGWWNYAWGNWFGGAFVSADGRTLTCDSPEWVAAFRWLNGMAEGFGRKSVGDFRGGMGNFDSPNNAFIAGKVAMVIQGVWMANFIRRYKPELAWGAAPFPGPGGTATDPVTLAQADVLIIPRGSSNPEAAWRFLRYVNSSGPDDPEQPLEGMELFCFGQGKHSPFLRTTAQFRLRHRHEYLQVFSDLSSSRNAIIEPLMPMWKEYRQGLQTAFEALWLKGDQAEYQPERILKALKERLQPKLDREWAKLDRLSR